jgi:beta-glucanase (GH16 family)
MNPFFILLMMISITIESQVMWQIKKDTSYKWFYIDGDEFNGNTINEEQWRFGMPWGNVIMTQDLYFSKENVVLQNGTASFVAKKEKANFPVYEWEINPDYLKKNKKKVVNGQYEVQYTAGLISSRQRYKYGYFEIRFKSNNEKGIWPAFWLFGGEPNEEIDFMELKGERHNQIHVDVHCPTGCEDFRGGFLKMKKNWGDWIITKNNLSEGWNIISGEWRPNYVKFYLNGQAIAYFEGAFKTSQYLLINTAVAKNGQAFKPGPDIQTQWPNVFEVDYVRIWADKDTTIAQTANHKLFELSTKTINDKNLYNTSLKRKSTTVYNKKMLQQEQGTITLLPIFDNTYSLSILGLNLGNIHVAIVNQSNTILSEFELRDKKYEIINLNHLPKGIYELSISVMNQKLTQTISVL